MRFAICLELAWVGALRTGNLTFPKPSVSACFSKLNAGKWTPDLNTLAFANMLTPPTPSMSISISGSPYGSRRYARCGRHVAYSAYPSTMTASSSNVSASANAVSDSCQEFKSYGCSPPSQSGSGRQTSKTMLDSLSSREIGYSLGTITSLLWRIRSSKMVNGAVSTSTSLQ